MAQNISPENIILKICFVQQGSADIEQLKKFRKRIVKFWDENPELQSCSRSSVYNWVNMHLPVKANGSPPTAPGSSQFLLSYLQGEDQNFDSQDQKKVREKCGLFLEKSIQGVYDPRVVKRITKLDVLIKQSAFVSWDKYRTVGENISGAYITYRRTFDDADAGEVAIEALFLNFAESEIQAKWFFLLNDRTLRSFQGSGMVISDNVWFVLHDNNYSGRFRVLQFKTSELMRCNRQRLCLGELLATKPESNKPQSRGVVVEARPDIDAERLNSIVGFANLIDISSAYSDLLS
jgi:hypothetical protein